MNIDAVTIMVYVFQKLKCQFTNKICLYQPLITSSYIDKPNDNKVNFVIG